MKTVHLYDLVIPTRHRWVPGDQYPRAALRSLLEPWRGRPPGGLAKVTQNLCAGLQRIGQPYALHRSPALCAENGAVGILNGPRELVRQVAEARRCITGVGVMDFPDQWPGLFEETRAAFHLQACEWAASYYRRVFGARVRTWPVGIDTDACRPRPAVNKKFDFLLYNKIRWPQELPEPRLLEEIRTTLERRGLTFTEVVYGRYPKGRENAYHERLGQSRAMLFVCENETQGIAYNEALSMGVPILAWNPGRWLDPNRHAHGLSYCPASSVPYWDERCGEQFRCLAELQEALGSFLERLAAGAYRPRDYILEHLTLERCAQQYVELLAEAAA